MNTPLRDFIYLDPQRVRSLAAQLLPDAPLPLEDRPSNERLFVQIEPLILSKGGTVDSSFDFANWKPEHFRDGAPLEASGVVRLLDFAWLTQALAGLPAVLRRMSKLEMEALKNSDEGRRMSKSQLQQRQTDNQVAISKVEEYKADELGQTVGKLYGDVVRLKIRPSEQHPQNVLIGSAYAQFFYDSPAALSQKYGIEIDAGWTIIAQVNMPNLTTLPQPIPVGNKMEDAFEQIALLMNSAFRLASSPTFPAVSITPLAIYRVVA